MAFQKSDPFLSEYGFFEADSSPSAGLLPLQTSPSAPDLSGLERGTGLLNPPLVTQDAVRHFPPDLYDMRPESHLMRFLRALLGDSGAGQLQKRNTLVRLASTLAGSHFYDLDGLYGAIFGEGRQRTERLPFDPHTGLATVDEWDEIRSLDAGYRNRIEALARAIPLGGTVPGIQMAAEAVVGVPCQVYEVWQYLGSDGFTPAVAYSWGEVTSDPDNLPGGDDNTVLWSELEGTPWTSLEGSIAIGRSENSTPAEFIVRPIKDYSTDYSHQERMADNHSLSNVLGKLKPAGALLTIDDNGLVIHYPGVIQSITSDSDFWEIGKRVSPKPVSGISVQSLYPQSDAASLGVSEVFDGMSLQPVPPMSGAVGSKTSSAPNVVGAKGYTLTPEDDGSLDEGVLSEPLNWDVALLGDGTREAFTPDRAVMDPRTSLAALMSEDASLMSHPYSGTRRVEV
jgi:hypothetical protein